MSLSKAAARRLRRAANRLDPPPPPPPPRPKPPQQPELTSDSEPGSRRSARFFDDYPRFYETSHTAANQGRLNLRYDAIFGENIDIFAGAKVLDIASHDGRWSLAALASGAESVVGIEARPELVKHASDNLAHYGYGIDRCSFVTGDVHQVFEKQTFDVDVVLCLGFLYHTLRYNELLSGIRRANPRYVLIDTQARMMHGQQAIVYLQPENVNKQRDAVADEYSYGDTVVSGRPNLAAIRTMMHAYGFEVERLSDWGGLLRDNPEIDAASDYAAQKRMTLRCVDRAC